jgi:hypothetical protein
MAPIYLKNLHVTMNACVFLLCIIIMCLDVAFDTMADRDQRAVVQPLFKLMGRSPPAVDKQKQVGLLGDSKPADDDALGARKEY